MMFIGIYFLAALFGFSYVSITHSSQYQHLTSSSSLKASHLSMADKKNADVGTSSQEKDTLFQEALKKINQMLAQEKNDIYLIQCDYKIAGKKILTSSVEVHYNQYRKKPKCEYLSYSTQEGQAADHEITFIYKRTQKKYLIAIYKNNKHIIEKIKHIPLSAPPTAF